ncbi:PREDICTED: opioid growth factor receptor-like protein 1, partial [Gekko japonicus]|uniref:Opioid growth factor receptor-like protein 1 n=1 Tax=Gekko japonicus TaxID=146911 RepID=A0ABM1KRP7_GEKJA
MGSLLSGVSFKEPTTVEDCDSTWETDSEPELQEPRGGGGEGQPLEGLGGTGRTENLAEEEEEEEPQQQQQGEPLPAASARPEDTEQREEVEEAVEEDLEGEDGGGGEVCEEGGGREEGEAVSTGQGDDAIEVTAKPKRSFYAARDLYKYRHQYPQNFKDLRYQNDLCNLRFYKNKIPFKPDGKSQHNYLRITRILKSLGELGYESFKPPLVKFILHEALVEDTIPNIKQSALEYFVYTIRDRRERRKLLRFAQQHYTPSDHFIWGPPRKQKCEGSKPSKKLASPVSHRNSCTSKHKKRDSKNASTVSNSSGKPTDEKRAGPIKTEEDHIRKRSSSETAKQSSGEKNSDLECQNCKLEGTASPSDQKENISNFKKHKGRNDENLNQDCRNPEVVEKDSCDTHCGPTDTSTDLQDSVSKDKDPVGSNSKSKEE